MLFWVGKLNKKSMYLFIILWTTSRTQPLGCFIELMVFASSIYWKTGLKLNCFNFYSVFLGLNIMYLVCCIKQQVTYLIKYVLNCLGVNFVIKIKMTNILRSSGMPIRKVAGFGSVNVPATLVSSSRLQYVSHLPRHPFLQIEHLKSIIRITHYYRDRFKN